MRTRFFLAACLLGSFAVFVLAGSGDTPMTNLPASGSIAEVLDDFHDAAARADEARYFGHFAEGAVFLGTDPTERWTVAEFRAWAKPFFKRDEAWTYRAIERHIDVAPSGEVGWFDEVVRNKSYGDLRGTGVVLRVGGEWKIAQYNLTFMVPNSDAEAVLGIINGDK